MKPIGNIFGFDCVTCEHNRHCYGGNMGNQFRYCQKSTEKIQNLDNLEIKLKKQKEVIDRLNFIKNRKNQGASQENINKMAIEFVDSWLKEVK